MLMFTVNGPFNVPTAPKKTARYIDKDCAEMFWQQCPELMEERGCYVFGFRASKGFRPVYVGKATKTFKQECFHSHKTANHMNPALLDTVKGTPVMFLLVLPRTKGKPNDKVIASLETFLIEVGYLRNSELSNIQNVPKYDWGVHGIIRGIQGKPTKDAADFKGMMGL